MPIRIVGKFINIHNIIFLLIWFILVGKPINVEKVVNPTDQQIKELHDKYCKGLETLYNEYKDEFWYDHGTCPPKIEFLANPLK